VGVVLTDVLPAGVTFVSVSQGSLDPTSRVVSARLGTLDRGATATVRLVVKATAVGTITNTIVVTDDVADPSSANDRIQVGTTIAAPRGGTTIAAVPPTADTTPRPW